jgi:hypothetical protein
MSSVSRFEDFEMKCFGPIDVMSETGGALPHSQDPCR